MQRLLGLDLRRHRRFVGIDDRFDDDRSLHRERLIDQVVHEARRETQAHRRTGSQAHRNYYATVSL